MGDGCVGGDWGVITTVEQEGVVTKFKCWYPDGRVNEADVDMTFDTMYYLHSAHFQFAAGRFLAQFV